MSIIFLAFGGICDYFVPYIVSKRLQNNKKRKKNEKNEKNSFIMLQNVIYCICMQTTQLFDIAEITAKRCGNKKVTAYINFREV